MVNINPSIPDAVGRPTNRPVPTSLEVGRGLVEEVGL
jgi:hypothetical protein